MKDYLDVDLCQEAITGLSSIYASLNEAQVDQTIDALIQVVNQRENFSNADFTVGTAFQKLVTLWKTEHEIGANMVELTGSNKDADELQNHEKRKNRIYDALINALRDYTISRNFSDYIAKVLVGAINDLYPYLDQDLKKRIPIEKIFLLSVDHSLLLNYKDQNYVLNILKEMLKDRDVWKVQDAVSVAAILEEMIWEGEASSYPYGPREPQTPSEYIIGLVKPLINLLESTVAADVLWRFLKEHKLCKNKNHDSSRFDEFVDNLFTQTMMALYEKTKTEEVAFLSLGEHLRGLLDLESPWVQNQATQWLTTQWIPLLKKEQATHFVRENLALSADPALRPACRAMNRLIYAARKDTIDEAFEQVIPQFSSQESQKQLLAVNLLEDLLPHLSQDQFDLAVKGLYELKRNADITVASAVNTVILKYSDLLPEKQVLLWMNVLANKEEQNGPEVEPLADASSKHKHK